MPYSPSGNYTWAEGFSDYSVLIVALVQLHDAGRGGKSEQYENLLSLFGIK